MNKAAVKVKATVDRWLEDRLEELGMTHAELAQSMQDMMNANFTGYKLTALTNRPERATAEEIHALATVLELKDWYAVLVDELRFGTDKCTIVEFNALLADQNAFLSRVIEHAA